VTVGQFRQDKGLREQWAGMLKNHELLKLVLDVLEESHPARFAIMGDNGGDISATRASIELGTTRGYSLYGDRLKMLAKPLATQQELGDTTYERTEK
jgi:hypothetical protein